MNTNFPKLSRRDFFKALVALGVVASFPLAKALPVTRKTFKEVRYLAIWQPPGQRAKLTMFAGDIPPGTEVFVAGAQRILRFTRYPETTHERISELQAEAFRSGRPGTDNVPYRRRR